MSKIAEAIDRIGERLETSHSGFETLSERRTVRQHRRQVGAAVLALAVVAGGFIGVASLLLPAHQRGSVHMGAGGALAATTSTSGCFPPSVETGPPNGPSLTPSSGTAGSTVTVIGQVSAYGPGGAYVGLPQGVVQLWWNLDPSLWWTALPGSTPSPNPSPAVAGPVVLLNSRNLDGACLYQMRFTVPDVSPGTYTLVVLHLEGQGQTSDGSMTFSVTP